MEVCRERQACAEGSYWSPRTWEQPGTLNICRHLASCQQVWGAALMFVPLRFGRMSTESCTISCIFPPWDRKPKKWWDNKSNFTCMEETEAVYLVFSPQTQPEQRGKKIRVRERNIGLSPSCLANIVSAPTKIITLKTTTSCQCWWKSLVSLPQILHWSQFLFMMNS